MKPWVDLGENCNRYNLALFCPDEPHTCWMCSHYWDWNNRGLDYWTCELEEKERLRKRLEASRYKGQLKLVVEDEA